jgi:Tol biopolymer transport system component/DNA-binding winged helix-turn-helix (wHTH) protein
VRHFGPYSLDLNTLELRKGNTRLRLKGQPLDILICLLEEPGQTVSRDELQHKLWPEGTFVDFDHSLNAAVNRLRERLHDSAENPRYIETVPGVGYKFVAPLAEPQPETAAAEGVLTPIEIKNDVLLVKRAKAFRNGISILKITASLIAAAVVLASIRFWFFTAEQQVLTRITNEAAVATDPAVSPDGRFLAYASDRGNGKTLNIWIHDRMHDVTDRQVTFDNADAHEPSFSADSSRIVYRSERAGGGTFVVPALGGEPVLMANEGRSPRFSPDGRWVAFWRGALMTALGNGVPWGAIYVIPSSGGSPKQVGTDLSWGGYPVWSPDSRFLLVFVDAVQGVTPYADWWAIPLSGEPSIKTGIIPFLIRQGFPSSMANGIPRPVQWTSKSIFFAADHGDTSNVWKLDFTLKSRLIKNLKRVTSSTNSDMCPAIAPDGTVYFASLNRRTGIWSLSMDTERAVARGQPSRVSSSVLPEISASSSLDGRRLAFIKLTSGHTQTWVRDLATGVQLPLGETSGPDHWAPRISRDGKWVAYATMDSRLYVVSSSGGPPLLAAEPCAWAWDWSHDDSTLLVRKPIPDPAVYRLDLQSHTLTTFLTRGKTRITQSRYAPDDRWIVFDLVANDPTSGPLTQARIVVAPLKNGNAGAPDTWIPIGHKTGWDDKATWSLSGTRMYFLSDEDGFRCIWTQVLNPQTKVPITPPIAVYHFHQARASLLNVGLAELNLAVAKDKVFFEVGELTGSIWKIDASK